MYNEGGFALDFQRFLSREKAKVNHAITRRWVLVSLSLSLSLTFRFLSLSPFFFFLFWPSFCFPLFFFFYFYFLFITSTVASYPVFPFLGIRNSLSHSLSITYNSKLRRLCSLLLPVSRNPSLLLSLISFPPNKNQGL